MSGGTPFDQAMRAAQSRQALERANDIKERRYRLRCELAAMTLPESRRALAKLIADPPDWLLGKDVVTLLCYARYVGQGKAERWAALVQSSTERRKRLTLGELTERQRKVLCDLLESKARGMR